MFVKMFLLISKYLCSIIDRLVMGRLYYYYSVYYQLLTCNFLQEAAVFLLQFENVSVLICDILVIAHIINARPVHLQLVKINKFSEIEKHFSHHFL